MRSRADAIAILEREHFDVVVIGGGITGAGVALDAATRGLSVALVERDDWSCGTSSRSSKMVHGGLRYLQNFDLGLVREALLERQLMVHLAPHLVRPLPFLVPAFEGARLDFRLGVGLNMYAAMATRRRRQRRRAEREAAEEGTEYWSPERHRTISGEEVLELLPALEERNPTSAYLFYDCQTDDSRLVLTVLGEAERFGAVCVNSAEVVDVIDDAPSAASDGGSGVAAGVACREQESGELFTVAADNVVNATGVWADRIRGEELHSEEDLPVIRPSRGAHLVISRRKLALNAAAIVPAGRGRTIFALPWLGQSLIGTTDRDYEGSIEHPQPDPDDVQYLLDAVNRFFGTELGFGDVTGAYAGVRPLISEGDPKKSVDISRRAELFETSSGMITITGGKLTTWRRMAKMAVDRLVERELREAPCRTHEIPLGHPAEVEELPDAGTDHAAREHLAARYGLFAEQVLKICQERPELAEPILPGAPDVLAEAVVAARHEQARGVSDVFLRRTRLGLLDARALTADASAGRRVAEAMAPELGWSGRRVKQETDAWLEDARVEGLVVGEPAPATGAAAG
jgi:glycerol-3-phosphate dehydrogenase